MRTNVNTIFTLPSRLCLISLPAKSNSKSVKSRSRERSINPPVENKEEAEPQGGCWGVTYISSNADFWLMSFVSQTQIYVWAHTNTVSTHFGAALQLNHLLESAIVNILSQLFLSLEREAGDFFFSFSWLINNSPSMLHKPFVLSVPLWSVLVQLEFQVAWGKPSHLLCIETAQRTSYSPAEIERGKKRRARKIEQGMRGRMIDHKCYLGLVLHTISAFPSTLLFHISLVEPVVTWGSCAVPLLIGKGQGRYKRSLLKNPIKLAWHHTSRCRCNKGRVLWEKHEMVWAEKNVAWKNLQGLEESELELVHSS